MQAKVHCKASVDLQILALHACRKTGNLHIVQFQRVHLWFKGTPLLPLLRSLMLRECSSLTGKSLPPYPQVTQLALIDCPVVTGDGLQHIIRKALPALQVISMHISAQNNQAMHMSLRALNTLHFGQNLHHIDLRGVSGLTLNRVIKFDYTMHRKQRQGKAQPCVTLLMPSQPLDKPEPVYDTTPTILLPNLYQLPNPGTFELVIMY